MKKFKTILSTVLALAMVFTLSSSVFAVEENTAFLAYADEAWAVQNWGSDDAGTTAGVVAEEVKITGPGQYTVSLDFTGTEQGKGLGVAFTAPMIQGYEATNPGHIIQIDSIKVNGSDIAFTESYTSCDADGKNQTRVNVYNSWVSDITDPGNNPRTVDGTLDGASAAIVDPAAFKEVETYAITFTIIDPNAAEVAEVEEVAVTEEAPATSTPKTGVVGLELVYGLGAVATALVAFKKRNK